MSGYEVRVDRRRRSLTAFLPFLVGVVEIVAFVAVGNAIGFGWAILLAIGTSLLGLAVMRRAGFRAWQSLRVAAAEAAGGSEDGVPSPLTGEGKKSGPEERIADAGVTMVSGLILLLPGFVSDVFALLLLTPPLRRKVGRRLAAAALRTMPMPRRPGANRGADVVEGEVVSDDGGPDRTERGRLDES